LCAIDFRDVEKEFVRVKKFLVVAAVFLLGPGSAKLDAQQVSAQATAGRFSTDAPAERILNLDDLKKQVKEYHACTCTCGCYAKDLDHQADVAIEFLKSRVKSNKGGKKLALVLDIDETALSNWEEMQKADFAYDSKAFNAWVETAAAAAIPGTLRLYKEAQSLGVSVFFLTGRPEEQRTATERNLRSQGFATWQQLMLRSTEQKGLSAEAYKSAERATIVAQGYTIVESVGDQWSDLKGKPEAEYSVKYPNPFYLIP
jgi:acid phosphatase